MAYESRPPITTAKQSSPSPCRGLAENTIFPDEPVHELHRRDEITGVRPHVEPRTPQDEAVVLEAAVSDHGVRGERRQGDDSAGDGVAQRDTQVVGAHERHPC
nr:unnamed protein product [Digitaria exilis]